jgi:ADP-dependent NAD(P)H-hydrate dehydratase
VPRAEPLPVTPHLLEQWRLPEPRGDGGKHERGTVLVVGGAASTPGAALLAGLAALRTGAGRLTVATAEAGAVGLGVALPEAMVVGVATDDAGSVDAAAAAQVTDLAGKAQVVVIGPGLLGREAVGRLLQALVPALPEVPVLLDALALSALADAPELARPLRDRLVLTPNAGEAAALLDDESVTGCDAALAIAERYGAVVATHGGVADPDGQAWSDQSGHIGLGTSGSGDVLAGTVGGLLAQGAELAQAAVFGQYVHSAAGDRLAARVGRVGFLARELLDELPAVLTRLRA